MRYIHNCNDFIEKRKMEKVNTNFTLFVIADSLNRKFLSYICRHHLWSKINSFTSVCFESISWGEFQTYQYNA